VHAKATVSQAQSPGLGSGGEGMTLGKCKQNLQSL
jgi:hypothetical protein